VNNSIILKELQVVYGTLRKGDEELSFFFFFFQKEFKGLFLGLLGWMDNSIPFQRRGFFFKGLA
jgi:hypothetical protein